MEELVYVFQGSNGQLNGQCWAVEYTTKFWNLLLIKVNLKAHLLPVKNMMLRISNLMLCSTWH